MVLFRHHVRPHLHDARVPWMEKAYTGIVIQNPREASVPVFCASCQGRLRSFNAWFHLHSVGSQCEKLSTVAV